MEVSLQEYVWIDGTGIGLRSKSRTLPYKIKSLDDLPNGIMTVLLVIKQKQKILR